MSKLGKYDVEIEELDEFGNVFDSHCVLLTDNLEEAEQVAETTPLLSPNEQVAIWEWNEQETAVEDSWVVKTYSEE